MFTSERFLWPEDIEVLLYLADDSNDRLREQAQEALALLKDVRIRELGISLLGKGPRAAALRMIINNIRADDEKMLECGIMKENYIEESKWDANLAIRKLVAPY